MTLHEDWHKAHPNYPCEYDTCPRGQVLDLENATYTAAEVKVLTEEACKVAAEAGRRIGLKEAAEDIARTADEIAEGCSAAAKQHRQASIDATTDRKKRSHMQTALAFRHQAAGAWAVRDFAQDYPYEALADATSARTDPKVDPEPPRDPGSASRPPGGSA